MTGISTSCGACKFLRRKCTSECVFAPYYSYNEAVAHFGAVHKVFGASNVSRLLLHLPEQFRGEAALTLSFEALARIRDPVYGCVAYIYALQQQVANLQEEIDVLGNHMMNNLIINESCVSHSHITYDHNNNNPLPSQSNHDQIINNWNNMMIIEHSSHAELSDQIACNNNHMMMNIPTLSLSELEGQNLIGFPDNGSGSQECFTQQLVPNQGTYYF